MLARMLGAASLSRATYEDVEHDRSATIQAMGVVILVSIASGVGGMLAGEVDLVRGVVFGVIRGAVIVGRMGCRGIADRHNYPEDPIDSCGLGRDFPRNRICANAWTPEHPGFRAHTR